MCARNSGCWTNADREWESDCVGDIGTEECRGWGYGAVEAALDMKNGMEMEMRGFIILESNECLMSYMGLVLQLV
jgi:hypothetical protein